MALLDMVRNGGVLAMLALAAGVLGVLIGAVGFAVKGKSAIGLGVVVALIGAGAAGLGILGTFNGKIGTDRALGMVNPADGALIRLHGYRESQDASWVGFYASLLPLLLGAAHVLRGRSAGTAGPVVASLTQPRVENPAPIAAVGLAFVGIGGLAAAGALVMARQPLPNPLGLDPDDHDAWSLASAVDEVKTNPERGCNALDTALLRFAAPAKQGGWPRDFTREPPKQIDWRPAANVCVERWATHTETGLVLTLEAMMESPMVHDTRLRGMVLQRKNEPNAAPAPPPDEPVVGSTGEGPSPAEIGAVVKRSVGAVRACYEKALKKNPKLEGKLVVQFAIAPDGKVIEAAEKSDPPFPDAGTTTCVLGRVRALKFPPHSKNEIRISYPFVFKAAG